ncbi:MAG: TSUP family transporter, partial [Actinomycetota bacterium]
RLAGLLEADGLVAAGSEADADIIVLNTCCIRENADNRLYGTLGHLKSLKDRRPDLQIAVGGCLAQKDRDLVVERAGHVDVVFGTHNLAHAPALLAQSRRTGEQLVEILEEHEAYPSALPARREVDHAGLRWVIAMRIPGTVLGVVIVSLVSQSTLLVAVGIAIVLGVALLRFRAPAEITAGEAGAAGFAAGVMGTTAAVDGPPLALLYQHHAGPRLRATLAVAFIVGSVMSASALAIGGQLTWHQVAFAAAMLPAVGLGSFVSHHLAPRVHAAHLRRAVLALAFAAGIAAILRGLL